MQVRFATSVWLKRHLLKALYEVILAWSRPSYVAEEWTHATHAIHDCSINRLFGLTQAIAEEAEICMKNLVRHSIQNIDFYLTVSASYVFSFLDQSATGFSIALLSLALLLQLVQIRYLTSGLKYSAFPEFLPKTKPTTRPTTHKQW